MVILPEMNNILKHPMDLGDLYDGLDVGSTCISGSEFSTGGSGAQHGSRQCLKVLPSELISICQR